MRKNGYEKLRIIGLAAVFALISLMINGVANAAEFSRDSSQERLESIVKTVSEGWQLKSNGGLLYVHPKDKNYWVSLSGVLRFDQTYFSGSYRDKAGLPNPNSKNVGFPSGGMLRKAEVDIVGGIGQDWNYTIGLEFGAGNGTRFSFADSWLAYSGFCDNVELFVGRHSANWFGLENSTSSSWYPFLERSMQANTFYPGDGLGLLVDYWWENGGFTALALQPEHGPRPVLSGSFFNFNNDRWLGLTAITFAPVHESGDVWHFGVSLMYRDNKPTTINGVPQPDFAYASRPSARARHTASSVNTGDLILNHSSQVNVEIARQVGPLLLQGEYTQAYLRTNPQGNTRFNGASFIGQYMLTGEVQGYDVRDGNFSGFQVCSPYGAFEVAARYDFIDLNDKNIRGGTQHDVTLGLNWYANDNIRVAFNYVNANFRPPNDAAKRRLDIFAARLQVKFK